MCVSMRVYVCHVFGHPQRPDRKWESLRARVAGNYMWFDLSVGTKIHCSLLQGQRALMVEPSIQPPSCEVFKMTYETSVQIGKGDMYGGR